MKSEQIFDLGGEIEKLKPCAAKVANSASPAQQRASSVANRLLTAANPDEAQEESERRLATISSGLAVRDAEPVGTLATLAELATSSKPTLPLTDRQAQFLLTRYRNDQELWSRFWQFMAQKSARGASFDYVLSSYNTVEEVWLNKPKPQLIRRGLFKRPA